MLTALLDSAVDPRRDVPAGVARDAASTGSRSAVPDATCHSGPVWV